MAEIIRCLTNPREVEAIQWDGKSTDQLKHWGCPVDTKPDDDGTIYVGELGAEEPVFVGWWIVKDPDDNVYWPEPPEKFALWFVPITQPTASAAPHPTTTGEHGRASEQNDPGLSPQLEETKKLGG